MSESTMSDPVILTASAKINLTLSVTGRDETGYHELVSAVCFASFGDTLQLTTKDDSTGLSLSTIGPFAPALEQAGGDSLLQAAYQLAADMAPVPLPAHHIILEKHIPLGGGLGGGSADAAAYLRYLSRSWPDADKAALRAASEHLGADVPACFDNLCHIMSGRGTNALYLDQHAQNKAVTLSPVMVLANPLCHADTAAVFGAYKQLAKPFSKSDPAALRTLITTGAWQELLAIGNDLTEAACQLYPDIAALYDEMKTASNATGQQIIGQSMSGSGASCFALAEDKDSAAYLQKTLHRKGIWAQICTLF